MPTWMIKMDLDDFFFSLLILSQFGLVLFVIYVMVDLLK
jgi:hypothetical protein